MAKIENFMVEREIEREREENEEISKMHRSTLKIVGRISRDQEFEVGNSNGVLETF
jgi:hypothetical protein